VSSSILQAPLPRPSRSSPLTALLGPLPPSLTTRKILISLEYIGKCLLYWHPRATTSLRRHLHYVTATVPKIESGSILSSVHRKLLNIHVNLWVGVSSLVI
jgi:hypothetical protein